MVVYIRWSPIKADKEVVMAAVQECGCGLASAASELCTDKEVVLAAVNNSGPALEFAHPELQADKEVVLAAVKADMGALALAWAAPELRADREGVWAAMAADPAYCKVALRFAAHELVMNDDDINGILRAMVVDN